MTDTQNPQLSDFPKFQKTIEDHLPDTVSLDEYFQRSSGRLRKYGFVDENTLGVVATCRDEIATPLAGAIIRHWGLTFNWRSLGGFLLLGKTGIKTAISHAPNSNGRRRFVLYAMPHIAISEAGEIGVVVREGIHETSHACGSLEAVIAQLKSGNNNVDLDMEDLEQSCVKQKLVSHLYQGQKPDLMEMTKLACEIIQQDADHLLGEIADPSEYDYAYMTGILIHGPRDTHWVCPKRSMVVSTMLDRAKKAIFDL